MAAQIFELGASIRCQDGQLGELADLIINPEPGELTHLVSRTHGLGRKRLIPLDLVRPHAGGGEITLSCNLEQAQTLREPQDVMLLQPGVRPEPDDETEIGVYDDFLVPFNDAGAFADYRASPDPDTVQSFDRIPKGHVEIRHESPVITADGHIAGSLVAAVVQGSRLSHLVLKVGHLWHRHPATVPVEAVQELQTDEVILRGSRDEFRDQLQQGFGEAASTTGSAAAEEL